MKKVSQRNQLGLLHFIDPLEYQHFLEMFTKLLGNVLSQLDSSSPNISSGHATNRSFSPWFREQGTLN